MASHWVVSKSWGKGKFLEDTGIRARVVIIQRKSIMCTVNPTEIEQKFTFNKPLVSLLQGLKVKSPLLSIYELLSALANYRIKIENHKYILIVVFEYISICVYNHVQIICMTQQIFKN